MSEFAEETLKKHKEELSGVLRNNMAESAAQKYSNREKEKNKERESC